VRHDGRSVVVTGGASGIGRGIVERFVGDGARVVIADVDEAAAAALAGELGERASAVACDVTDAQAVERAVDTAVERHGGLDVMVNNAGIIFVSPLLEAPVERWRRLLDVNVVGVVLGCQAAGRAMVRQGRGGVIVNASSGGGRHGVPNFAHYCASKAAIVMLSQALAVELAPARIRVNCYAPGHIATPLWETIAEGFSAQTGQTREQTLEAFRATIPWGRFGTPEDVAAAVSWLASDEAEYVSGQVIAMNGAELPWT
jgi:NAD(P)-dependent dehydrogenase (short-subunit alcohol dehydrogenase family)